MVMSLGWNPFYKNEILTAVSFARYKAATSFYNGAGNPYHARVSFRLLWIQHERLGSRVYPPRAGLHVARCVVAHPNAVFRVLNDVPEALIEDIEVDKRVALNSLQRPQYEKYREDPHFDLSCTVSPS
jgi:riboflavin kinase